MFALIIPLVGLGVVGLQTVKDIYDEKTKQALIAENENPVTKNINTITLLLLAGTGAYIAYRLLRRKRK